MVLVCTAASGYRRNSSARPIPIVRSFAAGCGPRLTGVGAGADATTGAGGSGAGADCTAVPPPPGRFATVFTAAFFPASAATAASFSGSGSAARRGENPDPNPCTTAIGDRSVTAKYTIPPITVKHNPKANIVSLRI